MVKGPEGQLSFSKSTQSHLNVNLKFRLYLYFEWVRGDREARLKMSRFAVKTETEIFEEETRLFILFPKLLHLWRGTLMKRILISIYKYGQGQKVTGLRHCTVDILNWPLPSDGVWLSLYWSAFQFVFFKFICIFLT